MCHSKKTVLKSSMIGTAWLCKALLVDHQSSTQHFFTLATWVWNDVVYYSGCLLGKGLGLLSGCLVHPQAGIVAAKAASIGH